MHVAISNRSATRAILRFDNGEDIIVDGPNGIVMVTEIIQVSGSYCPPMASLPGSTPISANVCGKSAADVLEEALKFLPKHLKLEALAALGRKP